MGFHSKPLCFSGYIYAGKFSNSACAGIFTTDLEHADWPQHGTQSIQTKLERRRVTAFRPPSNSINSTRTSTIIVMVMVKVIVIIISIIVVIVLVLVMVMVMVIVVIILVVIVLALVIVMEMVMVMVILMIVVIVIVIVGTLRYGIIS